jgi:hypothetical protein
MLFLIALKTGQSIVFEQILAPFDYWDFVINVEISPYFFFAVEAAESLMLPYQQEAIVFPSLGVKRVSALFIARAVAAPFALGIGNRRP